MITTIFETMKNIEKSEEQFGEVDDDCRIYSEEYSLLKKQFDREKVDKDGIKILRKIRKLDILN